MLKRICIIVAFFLLFMVGTVGCSLDKQSSAQSSNQIFVVQVAPPSMQTQLKAKEIDAFIAWEPFNAAAVKSGAGRYLVQSGQTWPNHPCCVLAAASSLTDQNVLQALVWANVKAIDFISNPANRNKLETYAEQFTGQSPQVVQEALQHIQYVEYPNATEFTRFYDDMLGNHLLTRTSADLGFANNQAFFANFMYKSVYDEVKSHLAQDPDWVPAPLPQSAKVRLGHLSQDLHELAQFVAEREGYYQKAGLIPGVNLTDRVYPNGVAAMQAFQNGEIDASYLGGAPATLKRVNDNIGIRIIGGANAEGSAIVVQSDSSITTVKELAGKTVAVPAVGTIQYFILGQAARQAGLKLVIK